VREARALSTGDSFACAATPSGVTCWGRNDQGELGVNPDEDNHVAPVAVRALPAGVARLSSAESATCALLVDATLRCWGDNSDGELGRGAETTQELAGPVSGVGTVADVAVGADHVCALGRDGAVYCWGANRDGQIGDGTTEQRLVATRVAR
jgi:alpha-tubulin suppressor-like RCC1 family protein